METRPMLKSLKTAAKTALLAFILLVSIPPVLDTQADYVVIVSPGMGEGFDADMQSANQAYIAGFHAIQVCDYPQFSRAYNRLRDLVANASRRIADLTVTSRKQMDLINSITEEIDETRPGDEAPHFHRLEDGLPPQPPQRAQLKELRQRQQDAYADTIQAISQWEAFEKEVKEMAEDLLSKWKDLCIDAEVSIFMGGGGGILVPVEVIGVTGGGGTGEGEGGEGEDEEEDDGEEEEVAYGGVLYFENSEWCSYWGWEVPIPIPITSTPPPTTPDEEPPPEGTPTTTTPTPEEEEPPSIVKAKVTDSSTGEALTGCQLKFAFASPELPLPGAPKGDGGYNEGPMQGITGPDGSVILASSGEAATEFRDGGEPVAKEVVEVKAGLPAFKSYIAKITLDKSKANWNDPASYLGPRMSASVVRKWFAGDSMYVVINIPKVRG